MGGAKNRSLDFIFDCDIFLKILYRLTRQFHLMVPLDEIANNVRDVSALRHLRSNPWLKAELFELLLHILWNSVPTIICGYMLLFAQDVLKLVADNISTIVRIIHFINSISKVDAIFDSVQACKTRTRITKRIIRWNRARTNTNNQQRQIDNFSGSILLQLLYGHLLCMCGTNRILGLVIFLLVLGISHCWGIILVIHTV